jgi:hypothetical protein
MAARWSSLAHGRLDPETLSALEEMLGTHTPPTSSVIWLEPGLQPPRAPRTILPYPAPPLRSWQLFAHGRQGSQTASWVSPGYAYEFRLRAGDDREVAATVTVVSIPPGAEPEVEDARVPSEAGDPYLTAIPNPASVEGTHATTAVHWQTGANSIGEVEMTAYPIEEGLPEEDADAVAALESLHELGAGFLFIPSACSWWVELYPGLGQYIAGHCAIVAQDEPGTLYRFEDAGSAAEVVEPSD